MAGLFKKKLLQQKLADYTIPDFDEKLALVQQWYEAQTKGILVKKTETECEQAFNDDFFKTVLGYASFPSNPYTIDPKGKTQATGQKPDAILGYYDPEGENTHKNTQVVVEIKDAKTPLDKSQRREGNLSPIQQGFKYKPQYSNCKWVIATNFIEIRLFKDNQLDYELWTLADLVNPDNDYYQFKRFHYLLNAENLISKSGASRTEKLLSEVRIEQEQITKKFYKEYKQLRLELINDMRANNPNVDLEIIIEKAQKVIDRLIFIHFCEDLGLLPEHKLKQYVERAGEFDFTPWEIIKKVFKGVDKGSDKLEIPKPGYNGGLFHQDSILDDMEIGDEVCHKFVDLGVYDFAEDLSVNILGHIFEQSISDLEELKEDILLANFDGAILTDADGTPLSIGQETSIKNKAGKRKKDGIFYTPEYIVDYIVKNSLGTWLEEQFETLKEKKFKQSKKMKDSTFHAKEKELYAEYQQILQNVKVLDPACGSGAFLVKVFDYLLEENVRVMNVLSDGQDGLFDPYSIAKGILTNNIYGVDLNEESVEISKLSLWLKTAEKGKKLADLDDNIKCGNSLIDDAEVAGEKAFKWEEEFVDIMSEGGFDVVVGNPPYGASIREGDKSYYMEQYSTASYKLDTYSLFIEKGIKILSSKGNISYIVPYTWLSIQQHQKLREFIMSYNLYQIVDLPVKVFQDADLDTVILFVGKNKTQSDILVGKVLGEQIVLNKSINSKYVLGTKGLVINLSVSDQDIKVLEKISSKSENLGNHFDVSQGLIPYDKYRGHTTEQIKGRVFHSEERVSSDYKNELRGENVGRYRLTPNDDLYIKYGNNLAAPREQRFFTESRILIREITRGNYYKLYSTYAEDELYNTPVIINIITKPGKDSVKIKFLLALINSKLFTYYHLKVNPKAQAKTSIPKILVNDVRDLPIVITPHKNQIKFIEKTDQMLDLNKEFYEGLQSSLNLLRNKYGLKKISKKLKSFYELEFPEFKKQLKLTKTSLEDEEELLSYFTKKKKEFLEIKGQIDATDREIDDMVFDLYGLTGEERKIVLDS